MVRLAWLLVAGASVGFAQTRVTLPKGVKGVTFGTAERYKGPGKEMCVIPKPVSEPVSFPRGVRELSYAVELEPRAVTKAVAHVIGDAPQELRAAACNVFTPIPGGFSQTQLGSTISRVDGGALSAGRYALRIVVDGQTVDVPFSIGK